MQNEDFAKLLALAFKCLSTEPLKSPEVVVVGGCWQRQQLHFHPAESERDRDCQGTSGHYASLLYFIYLPFIGAALRTQRHLKCLIDSLFPGGGKYRDKAEYIRAPPSRK